MVFISTKKTFKVDKLQSSETNSKNKEKNIYILQFIAQSIWAFDALSFRCNLFYTVCYVLNLFRQVMCVVLNVLK